MKKTGFSNQTYDSIIKNVEKRFHIPIKKPKKKPVNIPDKQESA